MSLSFFRNLSEGEERQAAIDAAIEVAAFAIQSIAPDATLYLDGVVHNQYGETSGDNRRVLAYLREKLEPRIKVEPGKSRGQGDRVRFWIERNTQ